MAQDVTEILTRGNLEDPVKFFLIAAIAAVDSSGKGIPQAEKYEVVFTINGHELKLEDAVGAFFRQHEQQVKERAVKLLRERFGKLEDTIVGFRQEIIRKASLEFGVNREDLED
jgi:hypothetical protein